MVGAHKQRAWSIIHLILLHFITQHLLYIIWPATCHARPSSYSPMLESDRLSTKHHALAPRHRRGGERRGGPAHTQTHTDTRLSHCSRAFWRLRKRDECLLPVPSQRSRTHARTLCRQEDARVTDVPAGPASPQPPNYFVVQWVLLSQTFQSSDDKNIHIYILISDA